MADEKDFQRWSKEIEFADALASGTTDAQRIATLEAELAEARGEVAQIVAWLRGKFSADDNGGGDLAHWIATAIAAGQHKGEQS